MLTIPSFALHRETSIESARSSIRQTAAREYGTAVFDTSATHHLVHALAHDFTLVVPPKVKRGCTDAISGGEPKQRSELPERRKSRDCGDGNSGERRGARSEFADEPPRMGAETDMEPPRCLTHRCRSMRWVDGPAAHTRSHSHDARKPPTLTDRDGAIRVSKWHREAASHSAFDADCGERRAAGAIVIGMTWKCNRESVKEHGSFQPLSTS